MKIKVYFTKVDTIMDTEQEIIVYDRVTLKANDEYEKLSEINKNSQEYKKLLNTLQSHINCYLKRTVYRYLDWEVIRFDNGYAIHNRKEG